MIAIPTGSSIHLSKGLKLAEQDLREQTAQAGALRQENEALRESARANALRRESEALNESEPVSNEATAPTPEDSFQAESPYAHLYPDFYAPQEPCEAVREDGVLYLTFDDGPSARTGEVLDVLKEKNVKATFFVVGNESESAKLFLRRIVEEGHTLAMHSYSHNYTKIYASVETYLADMYQIFSLVREATGVAPTLFRFPGGSINGYNRGIYQELIAEMLRRGFIPYDWNISSADAVAQPAPAETLLSNVVTGAENVQRGIVLMHDSAAKTTTVQALGPMIDRLREMGFELKALTPETMPVLFAYQDENFT